eukprot:113176_1
MIGMESSIGSRPMMSGAGLPKYLQKLLQVYPEFRFPSNSSFIGVWNSFNTYTQDWGFLFTCPWCDRGGDNVGECDEVGYDAIVAWIKHYRAQNCLNPTTV